MIQHGDAPYMECSSRGNKMFSAFYAKPSSTLGLSIEEAYQAAKIFEDGSTGYSIKEAKGKRSVNQDQLAILYEQWWRDWIKEKNLYHILRNASGLSDMFGQKGHICQATVLWKIRQEILELEKETK